MMKLLKAFCSLHTHSDTNTYASKQASTHKHKTKQQQNLWLSLSSHTYPLKGYLCATKVLGVSADTSSWGWTSNPQKVALKV